MQTMIKQLMIHLLQLLKLLPRRKTLPDGKEEESILQEEKEETAAETRKDLKRLNLI